MQKVATAKIPKMYICKYGIFYEGQELAHYCVKGGNYYYYVGESKLISFVVHYHNYLPQLYFRVQYEGKGRIFTLPVSQLGIFYRKYK